MTNIVIVGGGIIGCTTAYFLARRTGAANVTILEASEIAGGASGKAGGLLATWSRPAPISTLSWRLHHELAKELNGGERWQFRKNTTVSIAFDEKLKGSKGGRVPAELNWVDEQKAIGFDDMPETAQVHPRLFTQSMADLAVERGAKIVIGRATGVEKGAVTYVNEQGKEGKLTADKIVIAAGPWSSRIIKAPISGMRAHSVTITPSEKVSAHALFTDIKMGRKRAAPEFYAREDEVYICGEGDHTTPLPDSTKEVQVVESKCDDLVDYAKFISPKLANGKINVKQACYLPLVDTGPGPIIGEVSPGIYLAAGHTCWGIMNAPGTAQLLSELLIDGITSENIAAFHPKKYM